MKEFMNRLLIVAILLISTAPLYAQRQQPDVAKLKEDGTKGYWRDQRRQSKEADVLPNSRSQ